MLDSNGKFNFEQESPKKESLDITCSTQMNKIDPLFLKKMTGNLQNLLWITKSLNVHAAEPEPSNTSIKYLSINNL